MKYLNLLFLICTMFLFLNCSTEKKNGVEGVWRLVSGEYKYQDMIATLPASQHLISYKLITKTHFAVVTQDTSQQLFMAHSGTFQIGDNEYTEKFTIHKNPKNIGKLLIFKSHMQDDKWVISSDRLKEVWEKIE